MKPINTRKLAVQSLFAAAMAVCAWISVPLGEISFTMQSFALFLALFTLGGKSGVISFGVYLAVGAVGLPVFSGFQGGLGVLLGATGGYLWGFALAAILYWLMTHIFGERAQVPAAVLGMILCYSCGTLWYLYAYAGQTAWWAVAAKCVLPYLLPDALKIWLAAWLAQRLKRTIF